MIYLKLRHAGQGVNHQRVDRLYALESEQSNPLRRWMGGRLASSSRSRTILPVRKQTQA
jgi:hypothetical protein